MEAFDDGGGVDEVPSTQDADEVGVELRDLYPGGPMHGDGSDSQSWVEKTKNADFNCEISEFSFIISMIETFILFLISLCS